MSAENPENNWFDPDFLIPEDNNPDSQETPTNDLFTTPGNSYYTGLFRYEWTEGPDEQKVWDWVATAID